jgi:hypothetical protein
MPARTPARLSFRNFILHHLDDSATAEDAVSKFSEFRQNLLKHALELLKDSGRVPYSSLTGLCLEESLLYMTESV